MHFNCLFIGLICFVREQGRDGYDRQRDDGGDGANMHRDNRYHDSRRRESPEERRDRELDRYRDRDYRDRDRDYREAQERIKDRDRGYDTEQGSSRAHDIQADLRHPSDVDSRNHYNRELVDHSRSISADRRVDRHAQDKKAADNYDQYLTTKPPISGRRHSDDRHPSRYNYDDADAYSDQPPRGQHLDPSSAAGAKSSRSNRRKMESMLRNDSLSSDPSDCVRPPPPKPHRHKKGKKQRQQSLSSSDDEIQTTPECTSCEEQEIESESVSEKGKYSTLFYYFFWYIYFLQILQKYFINIKMSLWW